MEGAQMWRARMLLSKSMLGLHFVVVKYKIHLRGVVVFQHSGFHLLEIGGSVCGLRVWYGCSI